MKLDPKATAEVIRTDLAPPQLESESRHHMTFLEAVAEHLGLDKTPEVFTRITQAMTRKGIEPHEPAEYPKALNVKDPRGRVVPVQYPDHDPKAGTNVVFANADEEADYMAHYDPATGHRKAEPHHDEPPKEEESKTGTADGQGPAENAERDHAKA